MNAAASPHFPGEALSLQLKGSNALFGVLLNVEHAPAPVEGVACWACCVLHNECSAFYSDMPVFLYF